MTIRLFPAALAISGSADRLRAHETTRLRAAAHRARRAHPGSLGELAFRELAACADFGYRFTGDSLIARLATEILATPAWPSTTGGDHDH